MDFLKAILGDELYSQVENKINAHNGDEANKDSLIKLANLAGGEYVGKSKYDALSETLKGKQTELDTANNLIADLKKGTKGDEDMQGKITDYETKVGQLQAQLQETKINAALKIALMGEKALDVDYLAYKINEKLKGEKKTLELDDNENIKGWKEMASELKTQYPGQFEKKSDSRKMGDHRLPDGDERGAEPKSLAEALQMQYESKIN